MTSGDRRGESGQALVLAVALMPLFLAVVGLAVDGAVVFNARRELQNAADAAARAGAMQVDTRVYRDSAGAIVVLDQESARRAAGEYLGDHDEGVSAEVATEPERVVVRVSREVPVAFLRIVGIGSVRIAAVAPAEPRWGVERGNR
jgi:hypothetical protein